MLFNLIQSQTCIIYGPDQGGIYGQCQRKIKEEIEGKGSFSYFFNNLIGKVNCPTTKLNEIEKTFNDDSSNSANSSNSGLGRDYEADKKSGKHDF